MSALLNDHEITERVLSHIANRSTDAGDVLWREPVENYRSKERFEAETRRVLRRSFAAFCPSTALPEAGSFIARDAAGRPIVAVRGKDGVVRAFQNVCRHRGMRQRPRIAPDQGDNGRHRIHRAGIDEREIDVDAVHQHRGRHHRKREPQSQDEHRRAKHSAASVGECRDHGHRCASYTGG